MLIDRYDFDFLVSPKWISKKSTEFPSERKLKKDLPAFQSIEGPKGNPLSFKQAI
jgi:hypothetical protein